MATELSRPPPIPGLEIRIAPTMDESSRSSLVPTRASITYAVGSDAVGRPQPTRVTLDASDVRAASTTHRPPLCMDGAGSMRHHGKLAALGCGAARRPRPPLAAMMCGSRRRHHRHLAGLAMCREPSATKAKVGAPVGAASVAGKKSVPIWQTHECSPWGEGDMSEHRVAHGPPTAHRMPGRRAAPPPRLGSRSPATPSPNLSALVLQEPRGGHRATSVLRCARSLGPPSAKPRPLVGRSASVPPSGHLGCYDVREPRAHCRQPSALGRCAGPRATIGHLAWAWNVRENLGTIAQLGPFGRARGSGTIGQTSPWSCAPSLGPPSAKEFSALCSCGGLGRHHRAKLGLGSLREPRATIGTSVPMHGPGSPSDTVGEPMPLALEMGF
ncbi:hypothetical protein GOBAR_AA23257 [Gossypium barbadense]|uniref:Uncharacterized protein n=1 Tax=Gossypium barbadense TaxID=3634 RepID=A0A2P5X259_GOSBA|nr:hypothetical protein GOBAR_AA23257 [Gossypium barbadense]